ELRVQRRSVDGKRGCRSAAAVQSRPVVCLSLRLCRVNEQADVGERAVQRGLDRAQAREPVASHLQALEGLDGAGQGRVVDVHDRGGRNSRRYGLTVAIAVKGTDAASGERGTGRKRDEPPDRSEER